MSVVFVVVRDEFMRSRKSQISPRTVLGVLGVTLLAGAATGCSSDVLRFQDGFYGTSDQMTTSSVPSHGGALVPQANIGSSQAPLPAQSADSQYPSGDRPMAQPFPAAPSSDQNGSYRGYTGSIGNGAVQGSALPPPAAPSYPAPSQRHAEASGHGAPVREREMRAADARPAARPLESDTRVKTPRVAMLSGSGNAQVGRNDGSATLRVPQQQAGARGGESYVVKSGDTLAGISRRTNVPIDALKSANNLSGSAIRIGQTLVLPGTQSAPAKAAPTRKVETASVTKAPPAPKPEAPKVAAAAAPKAEAEDHAPKPYTPPAGKETNVASIQQNTQAAAPKSSGIGKLRWPARGQVVSRFGASDDGHRNDGIDISVPEGTPVKAAENGVVIYSGSGLKEYGNTVLIRHDDGLVTVYGYAKDLKVKRGDKVTRGEVIADSGMSGEANRPKLHFEVRKDATPVNPMSYLD